MRMNKTCNIAQLHQVQGLDDGTKIKLMKSEYYDIRVKLMESNDGTRLILMGPDYSIHVKLMGPDLGILFSEEETFKYSTIGLNTPT